LLRAGVYEKAIGQEFNLASCVETRIIDLANMINQATNNTAGIRMVPRRKWDTKSRLLGSIDKAREIIGYNPTTQFEEGLRNTIAWFDENWEKIEAAARFGPGVSSAVREMSAGSR